jgi:hypothetical protein
MRKQLSNDFKGTGPGSILDMPDMKYFPGHNALYIEYISASRAHDKIYMGHGDGYLKGFKAAKSQTPNLPSPPFSISVVTPPGSSCFLASLKAQKPPRHKGETTQSQVSPPSCLCVLVVPFSNSVYLA